MMAEPMTFDTQVRQLYAEILAAHDHETAAAFLAGVRFRAGYEEHGDGLFRKTSAELEWDAAEESADGFVYDVRALAQRIAETQGG